MKGDSRATAEGRMGGFAAAFEEGGHTTTHFGRADCFRIGRIHRDTPQLTTLRQAEPYGRPGAHRFDPDRMNVVCEALKDCARLYVSAIGEKPAEYLRLRNIEPIIFEGTWDQLIAEELNRPNSTGGA